MYILGVHTGNHDASACLYKDFDLIADVEGLIHHDQKAAGEIAERALQRESDDKTRRANDREQRRQVHLERRQREQEADRHDHSPRSRDDEVAQQLRTDVGPAHDPTQDQADEPGDKDRTNNVGEKYPNFTSDPEAAFLRGKPA